MASLLQVTQAADGSLITTLFLDTFYVQGRQAVGASAAGTTINVSFDYALGNVCSTSQALNRVTFVTCPSVIPPGNCAQIQCSGPAPSQSSNFTVKATFSVCSAGASCAQDSSSQTLGLVKGTGTGVALTQTPTASVNAVMSSGSVSLGPNLAPPPAEVSSGTIAAIAVSVALVSLLLIVGCLLLHKKAIFQFVRPKGDPLKEVSFVTRGNTASSSGSDANSDSASARNKHKAKASDVYNGDALRAGSPQTLNLVGDNFSLHSKRSRAGTPRSPLHTDRRMDDAAPPLPFGHSQHHSSAVPRLGESPHPAYIQLQRLASVAGSFVSRQASYTSDAQRPGTVTGYYAASNVGSAYPSRGSVVGSTVGASYPSILYPSAPAPAVVTSAAQSGYPGYYDAQGQYHFFHHTQPPIVFESSSQEEEDASMPPERPGHSA
ncbi:hypothetical protein BC830DRAFT_1133029 [Chytriomyces sp. MP71]|nr:hypothetical protein BC830DRAFT_1133029 [Chytriomyces sp. MP71]